MLLHTFLSGFPNSNQQDFFWRCWRGLEEDFSNYQISRQHAIKIFSSAVAEDLEALARGVSHILSLYFVIVLPSIFFVSLVLPFVCSKTEKHKKKSSISLFIVLLDIMSSSLLAININGYFL